MNTIQGVDPSEPGPYNENIQKKTHGVTVTQVFVVILILILLAASVYFYLNRKKQTAGLEAEQRQLETQTQKTVSTLADEVRNAAIQAAGNSFIIVSGPDKLVFRSDVTGDKVPEAVTYELEGTVLVRTVGDSTSSTRTDLATMVRNAKANRPTFTYFNNGDQLVSGDQRDIQEIKMFVEIDNNLDAPPPPFTVESTVEVKAQQ